MKKKLIDIFNLFDDTSHGIFALLQSYSPPWAELDIAYSLDLDYLVNYSGQKTVSDLIDVFLSETGSILDVDRTKIAKVVFDINIINWSKIFETFTAEYDALNDVNLTRAKSGYDQEDLPDTVSTSATTESFTDYHETQTQTPTEWETTVTATSDANNTTVTEKISAFNSDEFEDSKQIETDVNKSETTSQSGTFETDKTISGAKSVSTTNHSGDVQKKTTYNSAETTTGFSSSPIDKLSKQRELFIINYFRDYIYPTIDRILTIPIY